MLSSKKCSSCLHNDDVLGCQLTGDKSQAECIYHKFLYYKKGKRLFICERCMTNNVIYSLLGYVQIPPRPKLVFWCQKCNDYPIVEGKLYKGYDIDGIEFVKKYAYHKGTTRKRR